MRVIEQKILSVGRGWPEEHNYTYIKATTDKKITSNLQPRILKQRYLWEFNKNTISLM